jgi:hypothetical protein
MADGGAGVKRIIKPQPLKGLAYCVIYRHKNTQEARQVWILGAGWRTPPQARLSPAVSSLLARIAQHEGLPDAKIHRTWLSASLTELNPPMQRLLLRFRQDKLDPVLPGHLRCFQTSDI